MNALAMSALALRACLADLPPVQLAGLELIHQPAPTSEALRSALLELLDYKQACAASLQRLRDLPAVPLAQPLGDWVL